MRNSILRMIRVGVVVLWIAQGLGGCGGRAQVRVGPTAASAGGSPTQVLDTATALPSVAALPTATALPIVTPEPTIDSGTITPQNAGRQVELRQLGRGAISAEPVFLPDGRGLLLPTTTGVYRYETGKFQEPRLVVPAFGSAPIGLAPDGVTLAVGSRLYDISGAEGRELPGLQVPENLKLDGPPEKVIFSPDGQLMGLSYTYPVQRTQIFERTSRKLLIDNVGNLLGFSPDSSTEALLTVDPNRAQDRGSIHVYDVRNLRMLHIWQGERAVFLADGRLAVEAGGFTRIYDLASGRAVVAIDGRFAAFSPDGKTAAVFFMNEVRLVRVADRQVLARMKGSFPTVDEAHLRFAPDGKTLAGVTIDHTCCGGYDARLTLWNTPDGEVIFQEQGIPPMLVFAPDGQSFLASNSAVNGEVRRTSDGAVISPLDSLNANIIGVAFGGDGQELVAATYGAGSSPLLFYRVESGEPVGQIHTQINGYDYGLAASPDGRLVALSNSFWDAATGEMTPDLQELSRKMVEHFPYAAIGVAFSADSRRVATGALEGRLQVWDIAGQSLVMEETVCEGVVASVAFAPDGQRPLEDQRALENQRLALACTDVMGPGQAAVQVWKVDAGQAKPLMELKASSGGYARVAYSRDGKILAAAGIEVRAWNAADGSVIFTRPNPEVLPDEGIRADNRAESLAVSPDGQILAVGWTDGSVELWAIASGKKLSTLQEGADNPVRGLAFSPDGKILAVGLDDGAVKIWGIR